MKGKVEAVRVLLEMGASIHARDNQGRTALHLATLKEQVHTLRLLVQRGADVSHSIHPTSAYIRAKSNGVRHWIFQCAIGYFPTFARRGEML